MLRNKMFLGGLTLEDLHSLVKIRGAFSLGREWLPISRAIVRNGRLNIHMEPFGDPDVTVPMDSIVKVEGKLVRLDVDTSLISCGYLMGRRSTEIKIELYEEPFPETI